jgi:hypothetical protein
MTGHVVLLLLRALFDLLLANVCALEVIETVMGRRR